MANLFPQSCFAKLTAQSPQSSFSFTLLQLGSLANFVSKPWRTRKPHWEHDMVDLNHIEPTRLPSWKTKALKTSLFQLQFKPFRPQCFFSPKMAFVDPVTPSAVLCPRLLSSSINASFAFLQHLPQKRSCYPPNFFYKPATPLPNLKFRSRIIPRKASTALFWSRITLEAGSQGSSLRALKLSRGGHFWQEFGPRRGRLGANKSRLIGEEGFTRRTSLAQQLMRSPVATSPSTWSSVLETILNLQWHKIDKQWNSPDITIRSLSSKSKTCGSRSVPELPCWNYSLWHHSNLDSVYCCIWACWLRAYMRKPFFCAFFFQLKRE